MPTIRGPFDVKLTPQTPAPGGPESGLGRMRLDKQYHGSLEATATGEMLTAMSPAVKGSGCYVAVEQVRGSLDGRHGTFMLRHLGTMTRGTPELTIAVVPDSGTGDLTGLTGSMAIIITEGKHEYELSYQV